MTDAPNTAEESLLEQAMERQGQEDVARWAKLNAGLDGKLYGIERELRAFDELSGGPIVLANGEEWMMPSIPLGPDGVWFADQIDKITTASDEGKERETFALAFELFRRLLPLNYPAVTDWQCGQLARAEHVSKILLAARGMPAMVTLMGGEENFRKAMQERMRDDTPATSGG